MVDEKRSLIALLLASCVVTASTLATGPFPLHEAHAKASQTSPMKIQPWLVSAAMVTFLALPSPAFAEEFNYSIQSTGETVEICTKRGPLGACLKTEMRTSENDNDKSQKYFRDQGDLIREKEEVLRGSASTEGNDLINKLKKQTEENREKNELYVQRKTFENNQVCAFVLKSAFTWFLVPLIDRLCYSELGGQFRAV